jgi:hypothetical protein
MLEPEIAALDEDEDTVLQRLLSENLARTPVSDQQAIESEEDFEDEDAE